MHPWNIDTKTNVMISTYSKHIWFKHIYLDCETVEDYDNPTGNDSGIFHEKLGEYHGCLCTSSCVARASVAITLTM